jgi:hypothetical protein
MTVFLNLFQTTLAMTETRYVKEKEKNNKGEEKANSKK